MSAVAHGAGSTVPANGTRSMRMFRICLTVAGVLTGFYVLALRGAFGMQARLVVSDVGLVVVALLGAVACARAMVRERRGIARRGWAALAAAMLCWTVGEAMWSWYELVAGRESPFPSYADIAYLAAVLLAIIGVVMLVPTSAQRMSRARALTDAGMVCGSLVLVSWVTLLRPLARGATGGSLGVVIGFAYPIGDIVMASVVILAGARSQRRWSTWLILLGGGILSLAVADSGFSYLELHGRYTSGDAIDAAWFVGYALIGLAAYARVDYRRPAADRGRQGRFWVVLPYVVLVPAVAVGVAEQFNAGLRYPIAFVLLLALIVMLFTRQLLTVIENRAETIARMRSVDEMKSGFILAISHEFRTPMTSVVGFSKLLQRESLPEHVRRDSAAELESAAGRLSKLFSDLVDVDRLSRGMIESHREPTNLDELIERVLEAVALKDHRIVAEVHGVTADVDTAQVERIVEHLLVNVVRHTPDGTSARVGASRTREGVLITVEDDGPGVTDGLKRTIFNQFDQANVPEHAPGLGTGLALVARLARLHGGDAWVEDTTGGGASFRVLLRDVA